MINIGIKIKENDLVWNSYIDKLKSIAKITIIYDDQTTNNISTIDLLIATSISKTELQEMKSLKAIFLYKTGTDTFPMDLINERHIEIFPSYANADYIAEHAITLAMSLLHRVCEFDSDLRNGIWYADGKNYYWKSISNMVVGILGYGHIGKSIAKKISCISKNVIVINKSGKYNGEYNWAKNINELVDCCDILFVCIPKSNDTINIIDKRILSKMKDKYLVNVSRADVCNEKDLFDALEKGTLLGYASDVWYNNPNKKNRTQYVKPSNFSFDKLKNVIFSPHCATHEFSCHERYINDAVCQCIKYVEKNYDCI